MTEPALTPEQWAEKRYEMPIGYAAHLSDSDQSHARDVFGLSHPPIAGVGLRSEDRHALAALALHGRGASFLNGGS